MNEASINPPPPLFLPPHLDPSQLCLLSRRRRGHGQVDARGEGEDLEERRGDIRESYQTHFIGLLLNCVPRSMLRYDATKILLQL